MLRITGGQVFTGEAFEEKTLFVRDGRIVEDLADGADVEDIDARGCYVIPGLVDVHSHGAVGYDCDGTHEAIDAICRYQASRGVTAYCPATMTYPEEKLAGIARCAAEHEDADDAAALVGTDLEGPFISPIKLERKIPHTSNAQTPACSIVCKRRRVVCSKSWTLPPKSLVRLISSKRCTTKCAYPLPTPLRHTTRRMPLLKRAPAM